MKKTIIILIVFILSIGGFKTWTSGYKVNFIFNFVNGIKLGAPVRFAGVDVGAVKDIKFIYDSPDSRTKIKITSWVKREIKIPLDSTVWVNTLGLLGEKYIEVIPGRDYSRCLALNEELVGQDPMPMNEVTKLVKSIGSGINQSISRINNKEGTLGKLFYDDTIYNELEALVIDIRKHPWKLFWKGKEKK